MNLAAKTIKNIDAVIDLAIWLEKHGEAFYREAGASVTDPDLRTLFEHLVAEEQKHCEIYKQLAEQVTGKPVNQDELFGEYGAFIELLINELAVNLELKKPLTEQQLLGKAIMFEKDTLLYFYEIRSLFTGKELAAIDAICAEEKRHISRLINHQRSRFSRNTQA